MDMIISAIFFCALHTSNFYSKAMGFAIMFLNMDVAYQEDGNKADCDYSTYG